jgi:hypothetical protein
MYYKLPIEKSVNKDYGKGQRKEKVLDKNGRLVTRTVGSNKQEEFTIDIVNYNSEKKVLDKYGIKSELVSKNGPGGGHAEVKISGNINDIKDWWREQYDDGSGNSIEEQMRTQKLDSSDLGGLAYEKEQALNKPWNMELDVVNLPKAIADLKRIGINARKIGDSAIKIENADGYKLSEWMEKNYDDGSGDDIYEQMKLYGGPNKK